MDSSENTPTPASAYGPRPRLVARRAVMWGLGGATVAALALGGGAAALASGPGTSGSAPSSGSSSAPSAPNQRPTPKPHLDGTVVSANGSQIVITDHEGFQRTINVSSSTKYSDGISASVAAGTKIHAEGSVASDKTSLDATSVGKMPTPPAGGPGRGGPGGHGGPGKGPKPPSGTNAPKPPSGSNAPKPPSGTNAPSPSGSGSSGSGSSGSGSSSSTPAPSPTGS